MKPRSTSMSAVRSDEASPRSRCPTNGDITMARSDRSTPPNQRPPPSPPTITRVPRGVRTRRRSASVRLPPVSMITS
jgi:hypothetical protein